MRKNHARVSQLINNLNPSIHIKFNKNADLMQFEKDNPLINLLIIDVNSDPVFLTRNNASIKVTIVLVRDNRYSLTKPSIYTFNSNIAAINRINKSISEKYKLRDEIKKIYVYTCGY